jgi:hypothetical protein
MELDCLVVCVATWWVGARMVEWLMMALLGYLVDWRICSLVGCLVGWLVGWLLM